MPASSVSKARVKTITKPSSSKRALGKTTDNSPQTTKLEVTTQLPKPARKSKSPKASAVEEQDATSSMAALFNATATNRVDVEFDDVDLMDVEEDLAEEELSEVCQFLPLVTTAQISEQVGPCAKLARRDEVVLQNLPLVKAIALRVHENLPVHVDLDDLVHAGILGLFDAVTKFNPDKMVTFSSYAKHRIKGAILDSLRQLDWASRDLRRRHKQVEQATRELTTELQRAPSEAELAGKLGVDVERWRQMAIDLRNVGLISASTRANESDDLPAPEFPSKAELQPDRICAHEQMRDMLSLAMKTLPERYQKVVFLYYSNEMTMKEIGTVLGINESRVSQIHKTALEKMSTALQEAGITSAYAFQ